MNADRRRKRPSGSAEMEIRAAQHRRTPGYTVVKDWVPACVSAPAGKLYHFYRMHLNHKRDDGLVWPTMETAAVYLGLSRGDKVTPYMDELEAVGAIHATREGQEDGRYLVLVYEDPPDDFDGPVTLVEWYQANRAELDRRREAAKAKRAVRKAKVARPGDTPKTGDPADTPETGVPDTPPTGEPDTPSTGREPLRTRTKTNTTIPPTPRREPPTPPTANQGGEEISQDSRDPLAALADELHGRRPGWSKAAIRRVLAEEAAAGRPLPLLAEAARQCAADMTTRAPGRIREGGPWWDTAAAVVNGKAAPARPPWCGECESNTRRLVYIDGDLDRPARCPRCGTATRPLAEVYT